MAKHVLESSFQGEHDGNTIELLNNFGNTKLSIKYLNETVGGLFDLKMTR